MARRSVSNRFPDRSVQGACGPHRRRSKQDGVTHVDQDQDCRPRACDPRRCRLVAATTIKAEAYPINNWAWGVGAGLATAAIVGSAVAASNGPVYYTTYRRCGWQPRYNVFGQYIGAVRVCTY